MKQNNPVNLCRLCDSVLLLPCIADPEVRMCFYDSCQHIPDRVSHFYLERYQRYSHRFFDIIPANIKPHKPLLQRWGVSKLTSAHFRPSILPSPSLVLPPTSSSVEGPCAAQPTVLLQHHPCLSLFIRFTPPLPRREIKIPRIFRNLEIKREKGKEVVLLFHADKWPLVNRGCLYIK